MTTMNSLFAAYTARKHTLDATTAHNPFASGIAWIASQLTPYNEALIPLRDQGFLHSDLTYDVPSIWDGRFFRLADHLDRIERSCAKIRLTLPKTKSEIRGILVDMAVKSGIRDGYVNIIVTRGLQGVRDSLSTDAEPRCNLYLFVVPYIWVMPPSVQLAGSGTAIVARTVRRTPPDAVDPTVKNLQWGDFTRAMYEAKDRGAMHPFLTDGEGSITEGSGFNICFVWEGVIYSPERGVLEGVTRRSVFDAARKLGVQVRCERVPVAMAYKCEECFMCTTAGGIMPITKIDGGNVGDGKVGGVTRRIWDAYWDMHYDETFSFAIDYGDGKAKL